MSKGLVINLRCCFCIGFLDHFEVSDRQCLDSFHALAFESIGAIRVMNCSSCGSEESTKQFGIEFFDAVASIHCGPGSKSLVSCVPVGLR
ncbi:MAG: hypothetical protein ACI8Z5_000764 [Lentimonas sp.]|jgi:hypothetical protein